MVARLVGDVVSFQPADPEPWMDQGSCLNEDPEKFFPEGKGSIKQLTDDAKAICITKCSVRLQCLARTLAQEKGSSLRFGVAGGMTATERELLQKKLDDMQKEESNEHADD
ncbi:WhiB family transcription factor [Microbacterium phage AloeVera]|uniref:WhiB family transcription factor n=1 Tax=Microbacterium phage Truong TaxID=2725608 RepID=A0A6M3SZI4_9CAUD|nr:WhiB family transcription factor [Microbacterium phage Truong]